MSVLYQVFTLLRSQPTLSLFCIVRQTRRRYGKVNTFFAVVLTFHLFNPVLAERIEIVRPECDDVHCR